MQLDGAALSHIALIGNFLPRKCGIATYTTDTFEALRRTADRGERRAADLAPA